MRIVFLQLRKQVSTVRVRWPAAELRRRGHDAVAYSFGGKTQGPIERGDVVVLHATAELGTGLLSAVASLASFTRTIVQFDDDWTALRDIQDLTGNDYAVEFMRQIPHACMSAHGVIVSTPVLADAYSKYAMRCHVVRNHLPAWVRELTPDPESPAAGRLAWMGRFGVHTRDWEELRSYMELLPPLALIGSGEHGEQIARGLGARDVVSTPGTDNVRELYRHMAAARAAVVPLRECRFNAGKSWLKPLEFATVGVPVATSRVPAYDELAQRVGPDLIVAHDPEQLVGVALHLFENSGTVRVPETLTMEQDGGDAWETALGLT